MLFSKYLQGLHTRAGLPQSPMQGLFGRFMGGGNDSGGFAPGPMGTPRWGDSGREPVGRTLFGQKLSLFAPTPQRDRPWPGGEAGGEYKRGRLIDAKPFSFGTT